MKERPIMFSPAMARAIAEGRKTQTRRVIRLQPVSQGMMSFGEAWKWNEGAQGWFSGVTAEQIKHPGYGLIKSLPCPYGRAADRLWVKEPWGIASGAGCLIDPCLNYKAGEQKPLIRADSDTWSIAGSSHEVNDVDLLKVRDGWRNAMFMPRWASRLLLEISEVRVRRLQEISEEDARAEGLACVTKDGSLYKYGIPDMDGQPGTDDLGWIWSDWEIDPRRAYRRLWDSINAERGFGWDTNPWVWALSFSEVKK